MFIFPVILVDSFKGLLSVASKVMGDAIAEVPAARISVEKGTLNEHHANAIEKLINEILCVLEAEIAESEAIMQKVVARFAESKTVRNTKRNFLTILRFL